MRIVELFAGIGGFRLGIGEGHQYVFVNDMEENARKVYNDAFGHSPDPRKIEDIPAEEIPDHDLLCGGFPCATFSIAGTRKGLSNEHQKGLLFYDIVRVAEAKEPRFVLLENVEGLLTHDNGRTFGVVLYELGRLGYSVQYQKFDSVNFGTPQHRERVFVLAIRGEGFKVFPIIPKTKTVFDGEVLQFRRGVTRTFKKGTFPCLTASMGTGGNNIPLLRQGSDFRKITEEECEMLQGIPIGHTKAITGASRYERLGRTLNPRIVKAIMEIINEHI